MAFPPLTPIISCLWASLWGSSPPQQSADPMVGTLGPASVCHSLLSSSRAVFVFLYFLGSPPPRPSPTPQAPKPFLKERGLFFMILRETCSGLGNLGPAGWTSLCLFSKHLHRLRCPSSSLFVWRMPTLYRHYLLQGVLPVRTSISRPLCFPHRQLLSSRKCGTACGHPQPQAHTGPTGLGMKHRG